MIVLGTIGKVCFSFRPGVNPKGSYWPILALLHAVFHIHELGQRNDTTATFRRVVVVVVVMVLQSFTVFYMYNSPPCNAVGPETEPRA